MTYEELIKTVSEIVNNQDINKNGLSLVYELPNDIHEKINRDIFYRMNTMNVIFEPTNIFEVEIGGILIKFIKKN
jgi:hypothetical protein